MSRSCNKEQLLVFIVRQNITLKHAILSLLSGPGSTRYLQSPRLRYNHILSTELGGGVGGVGGGGGGGGGGGSVIKH